mmetsp:Transcript_115963/g.247842  ORF Transcript_115963/g.247842 Transcript_115963/m.247842 type:complete len:95 (+) Transcript_115963:449-733(+)
MLPVLAPLRVGNGLVTIPVAQGQKVSKRRWLRGVRMQLARTRRDGFAERCHHGFEAGCILAAERTAHEATAPKRTEAMPAKDVGARQLHGREQR